MFLDLRLNPLYEGRVVLYTAARKTFDAPAIKSGTLTPDRHFDDSGDVTISFLCLTLQRATSHSHKLSMKWILRQTVEHEHVHVPKRGE